MTGDDGVPEDAAFVGDWLIWCIAGRNQVPEDDT
jgi:hypothetical protein